MSEKTVTVKWKPHGSEGENQRTIQPFNPTEGEFTICNPQITELENDDSDYKIKYVITFEAQEKLTLQQINWVLNVITQ